MIDINKRWLLSNFKMKDIGEANYVLRVEIITNYTKRSLGLTQETSKRWLSIITCKIANQ
jgi:hypothetical protein